MQKLSVSKIILALPSLSVADRAAITAALTQLSVKEAASSTPLYEALTSALGIQLSFPRFTQTGVFKQWPAKSKSVDSFIRKTFPGIRKTAEQHLLRMCIEGLVADLTSKGVTPSLRAVVLSLDSLPAQFDRMFPGYRQNGLAALVLKAMIK